MGFLSATQLELASGRSVLRARLYHFDFSDGSVYLWDGWGRLDFDGVTWEGIGTLGQDSEIGFGVGDTAGDDTLSLSGVSDEFLEKVRNSEPVRGRSLYRYLLFFGEDLQPRDSKILLKRSIMDRLSFSMQMGVRTITLHSESIFADRNGAAFAYYSDRDQEQRFPGDRGLEFITTLASKTINWPIMEEA